jgi:hypothetical protein
VSPSLLSNTNWASPYILKQAEPSGVLLAGMGCDCPHPPIYRDRILLNASQVTNPSIDPRPERAEISRTRMIPKDTDTLSPAPHYDIYFIENLRQLIYARGVGLTDVELHTLGIKAAEKHKRK